MFPIRARGKGEQSKLTNLFDPTFNIIDRSFIIWKRFYKRSLSGVRDKGGNR